MFLTVLLVILYNLYLPEYKTLSLLKTEVNGKLFPLQF